MKIMKISKISSIIPFVIFVELICFTQTILTNDLKHLKNQCLEFTNPLNHYESRIVDCPTIESLDKRAPSGDMFVVNFNCKVSDKELCDKVDNVFNTAGRFITATINLKTTINVDAQFVDLCQESGECDTGKVILGAARPSRMLPHQDSDKLRFYPQALYKQMSKDQHPQFGNSDISAIFNSNADYWFEGDSTPTSTKQVDMLYVVLHELIHGLGFTNSWNDYASIQALTPAVGGAKNLPNSGGVTSPQFFEFAFDKYLLLLQNGKSLTSITDELNQFKSNSASNPDEFFTSFAASPQFSIAQDMYKAATTNRTIGFLLTSDNLPPVTQLSQDQINNDVVILETSLNPFDPGSSVGHVDLQTYLDSSDFLMMYSYPPGKTLDEMMSRAGSTDKTGPIGPKLRRLLGVMGYDIKNDYSPPKNNSSFISFNLVLSLVCMLLTLISNFYF